MDNIAHARLVFQILAHFLVVPKLMTKKHAFACCSALAQDLVPRFHCSPAGRGQDAVPQIVRSL